MTDNYELARRYSKALFESLESSSQRELLLEDLRILKRAVSGSSEIENYLNSPVVAKEQKISAMESLSSTGVNLLAIEFLKFLVLRDRVDIFSQIVESYQDANDEANGVVRGIVRSVKPLLKNEREALSEKVSQVTKKRAILEYKEEENLIGGLVAQVGSYKFDDSLETQLHVLSEELKRRAN